MKRTLFATILFLNLATSLSGQKEGFSFGIGLSYDLDADTSGHLSRIKLEVDINHSNFLIDEALKPIVKEANTCLDYNPEKINQLDRKINQLEQIASRKQAVSSEKKDPKTIAALAREVQFLALKKQLNAMPLDDENNPNLIATRDMLRKIQEKNGY
jgi:hypothetical protein